jgi:hypothetical protein
MQQAANMSTLQKKHDLPETILQLVLVGLLCLGLGIVVGDSAQNRVANVLVRKRETVNSLAKDYGYSKKYIDECRLRMESQHKGCCGNEDW